MALEQNSCQVFMEKAAKFSRFTQFIIFSSFRFSPSPNKPERFWWRSE